MRLPQLCPALEKARDLFPTPKRGLIIRAGHKAPKASVLKESPLARPKQACSACPLGIHKTPLLPAPAVLQVLARCHGSQPPTRSPH